MSKIGKTPISLPSGVKVSVDNDNLIKIKGQKGELGQKLAPYVTLKQADNQILVSVKDPADRNQRSVWGLSRSLINNMVRGVTQGYEKKLEINGVGYRAALKGKILVLNVGFSHPVEFALPEGIEAKIDKNIITLLSIDKQLVGEIASQIRRIRPPEPYKGKGIKYIDEVIRRKAGKVAKSTETTK